jgi:hypothetical protein
MKVYHYTKSQHLEKILDSKVINLEPTSYDHQSDAYRNKKPELYVWLTTEDYVPNIIRPIHNPTTLDGQVGLRRFVTKPEANIFYRFIFDTSDKGIIPWSVRQRKQRGSKMKAYMKAMAKAAGDDQNKWWVSLEPLEIGEYEKAELHPAAKDSYTYAWVDK